MARKKVKKRAKSFDMPRRSGRQKLAGSGGSDDPPPVLYSVEPDYVVLPDVTTRVRRPKR